MPSILALTLLLLSQPFMADSTFDIQGHRGARGLLPENSVHGFLKALELGVTTLELDLAITGDDEVVVSHEPWFSADMCSTPDGRPIPASDERLHNIRSMTYREVAEYDCGMRGNPRFPRQAPSMARKPLLREVFDAAENYRRKHELAEFDYNIETKSRPEWDDVFTPDPDTFTRLVYASVSEAGLLERTTLQSFDVRTLQIARELNPEWRLVLLIALEQGGGVDLQVKELGFIPATYSPDYRLVTEQLVERAHQLGMRVIPWTVNDPSDMQRLYDLNVDGIITDYPDVAVQLFPQHRRNP
jgi:glycerophosphoryl diester phosphodiesterase